METENQVVKSLYEAFQHLTEARRGQGKRYQLALILSLLMLAKLAEQQTLSGATEWIRHRSTMLEQRFGLIREEMPCQTTRSNVLKRVDATEILKTGKIRHEVVYGLSSLSMCHAPPKRLLQLNQDHWGIENRLHGLGPKNEPSFRVKSKLIVVAHAKIEPGIVQLKFRMVLQCAMRHHYQFEDEPILRY